MEEMMLSATTQKLTYTTAGLFALMGLALFAAPGWAAANAAWKISPFVAIAIGRLVPRRRGDGARGRPQLELVGQSHAANLHLGLQPAREISVMVAHRQVLHFDTPFGIAYTIALSLSALATLASLADWVYARPQIALAGGASPLGHVRWRRRSCLWWRSSPCHC